MALLYRHTFRSSVAVLCVLLVSCAGAHQGADTTLESSRTEGSSGEVSETSGSGAGQRSGTSAGASDSEVSIAIRGVDGPVTGDPAAAVNAQLSAWRTCASSSGSPALGTLSMDLILSHDGSVVSVHRLRTSIADEALVACALEAAGAVRFGSPRGSSAAAVTITLTFGSAELASAQNEISLPIESCDVMVDCDCNGGTMVPGRRDSTSCCELDCGPGEEIIEVGSGESRRYRCVRCR